MEFALLFPVFITLCIGMITFGFAFANWINVTQAARETSRFGATYPVSASPGGDTDSWLDEVGAVAAESAGIDVATADASSYFICIALFDTSQSPAISEIRTWGSATSESTTCTHSGITDSRVEVAIVKPSDVNWVFGGGHLPISGRNTSRYEPAGSAP